MTNLEKLRERFASIPPESFENPVLRQLADRCAHQRFRFGYGDHSKYSEKSYGDYNRHSEYSDHRERYSEYSDYTKYEDYSVGGGFGSS